jgi:hypothetical protein
VFRTINALAPDRVEELATDVFNVVDATIRYARAQSEP